MEKPTHKEPSRLPSYARTDAQAFTLERAWVGDAVLSYHVRHLVLAVFGRQDGRIADRVLCNNTLRKYGFFKGIQSASEVEAHIFDLHQRDPDEAKQFVVELFNWTLKDELLDFGGYVQFNPSGKNWGINEPLANPVIPD